MVKQSNQGSHFEAVWVYAIHLAWETLLFTIPLYSTEFPWIRREAF
ncbi:hypothetical protein CAP2UW1_4633 (plasmid) [Candidatus Accumulibacter phosphatis clade IIA str. UW-1]|jgi:hypothetical protein|uniref:Uncharacterized protein n=1 Tax=Accumulibacter regalis TaxID=522306 RepID=C7RVV3_ACCRE